MAEGCRAPEQNADTTADGMDDIVASIHDVTSTGGHGCEFDIGLSSEHIMTPEQYVSDILTAIAHMSTPDYSSERGALEHDLMNPRQSLSLDETTLMAEASMLPASHSTTRSASEPSFLSTPEDCMTTQTQQHITATDSSDVTSPTQQNNTTISLQRFTTDQTQNVECAAGAVAEMDAATLLEFLDSLATAANHSAPDSIPPAYMISPACSAGLHTPSPLQRAHSNNAARLLTPRSTPQRQRTPKELTGADCSCDSPFGVYLSPNVLIKPQSVDTGGHRHDDLTTPHATPRRDEPTGSQLDHDPLLSSMTRMLADDATVRANSASEPTFSDEQIEQWFRDMLDGE